MRLYIMVIAFAFSSWLTAVKAQTPVIGSVTDDYPQLHTGIATLYINTATGKDPVSKEYYSNCTVRMVENGSMTTYISDTSNDGKAGIRGRGNSTWSAAEKKPWRIKFKTKQRLLGDAYANAKSWTLLANAFDKSLMRNALTWHLGRAVGMAFCPAYKFVDLVMNGTHRGVYQISDQVQTARDRVFVDNSDTDLLLEYANNSSKLDNPMIDFAAKGFYDDNDIFVNSPQIYGHIGIKNPEDGNILNGEPQFFTLMREQIRALIQDSLATALHPLTGNLRFTHPLKGYRSMINPESLITWYIATEISANWDGLYSVYMYGTVDSPIYFGPLWDYDLAYGNHVETYNTRYFPQGDFYDRLLCENNFDRSMGDYAYRRLQPVDRPMVCRPCAYEIRQSHLRRPRTDPARGHRRHGRHPC